MELCSALTATTTGQVKGFQWVRGVSICPQAIPLLPSRFTPTTVGNAQVRGKGVHPVTKGHTTTANPVHALLEGFCVYI